MNTTHQSDREPGFCGRAVDRNWVIPLMILGYIFWWPAGLFLTFYMIWGDRMISEPMAKFRNWEQNHHAGRGFAWSHPGASRPSGNMAFDAYKAEMLKRLEDEQAEFHAFLDRLRHAKDKTEFDQFMSDRAHKTED